MIKIDPIIAVQNVEFSANWYASVFECRNAHGGNEFAVLESESGDVLLCLHKWNQHDHPTMKDASVIAGNGLLLYFRTDKMPLIRNNLEKLKYPVEKEIHLNANSTKMEFSVRDPDGYYLTITEMHEFAG